jgi:hypothetical protein
LWTTVLSLLQLNILKLSYGQPENDIAPWKIRFGKLRADVLEKIFPGLKQNWQGADPFSISFFDLRDPLEAISFMTLYLPGMVFMFLTLFHCVPHIINFFLFLPKMWFFAAPCLYEFNQSWFKRRRKRSYNGNGNIERADDGNSSSMGACDSVRLTYITSQVYNSLVKMVSE